MDIGAILQRRDLVGRIGALALSLATGGCERLREKLAAHLTRRNVSSLAANDPILQTYRDAIGTEVGASGDFLVGPRRATVIPPLLNALLARERLLQSLG